MKKNYFQLLFRNNNAGLLISILVLFLILGISNKNFLTALSFSSMGGIVSIYVLIALSQALSLVVGNMNLSIGAIGGLSVITVGYFLDILKYQGWISVIIAISVGIIAGLINGIIVSKFNMNSFVATLGTSFLYTGIIMGFTRGISFTNIPASFLFLGKVKFLWMPILFYIVLIILIIIFIYFKFTIIGKRMLAVGENITAAKFSGINTDNIIILSHTLSGFLAATAGVLYVSRIGSANPNTGEEWLIISFAMAIIGGTSLSGGSISAFGIFLGGMLIMVIKNALILLKVNIYWEQAFLGLIILIFLVIDRLRKIYNVRSLTK